ncbi:MAG: amidohydrolase family protein [Saprospiraceae bacterium]|nr:amidohydrolase family protein [Saprospiraceae bacterium]
MLRYITTFICLIFAFSAMAQSPVPARAQSKPVCITGATAHLGNGQVIDNALIAFENGKLTRVEAYQQGADLRNYEVVDAKGKHVYPGFIATNTTLGLVEIGAVRATNDNAETGTLNPSARSIIAYNTDSEVTPTVRSQGVLLAQITPQGGLVSGSSSVVQLDAWNWEDAAYATDIGLHLNWPARLSFSFFTGESTRNERYEQQIRDIEQLMEEAAAYARQGQPAVKNLKLEAMRGLFSKEKKLYVSVNGARDITQTVLLGKKYGVSVVIVGGRDSWMLTDLLKENNVSVILGRTHSLPGRDDDDVDQPFKTPAMLHQAGVLFCISNDGFWQQRNLAFQAGHAVGYGLPYEAALSAITLNAAKILGIDKRAGTLETGKDATLFISEGDALDMRTSKVTRAFIQGRDIDLDNKQKVLYRKFKEKYSR